MRCTCRSAPRSSSRSSGARWRLKLLSPARPLACLHRALGQEQKEDREENEEGDVIEIDHALGESAELIEQRDFTDEVEPRTGDRGLIPVENPEEQQRQQRPHPRHHLALAERRYEKTERNKRASNQHQA